jgi:hypothetical protein
MKFGYALLLATSVAVTGCSDHKSFERNDQPAAERDDQVAITTRDGNVVLALTGGNTVAMRLSDSLRSAVNSEIAQEFAKDSAESRFGRWVQRKTANLVSKGMAFEFSIPVEEIEDVTYENGEIRFEYRKGRKLKFDSFKNDGRSAMSEFAPEDAERFVKAVRRAASRSS